MAMFSEHFQAATFTLLTLILESLIKKTQPLNFHYDISILNHPSTSDNVKRLTYKIY